MTLTVAAATGRLRGPIHPNKLPQVPRTFTETSELSRSNTKIHPKVSQSSTKLTTSEISRTNTNIRPEIFRSSSSQKTESKNGYLLPLEPLNDPVEYQQYSQRSKKRRPIRRLSHKWRRSRLSRRKLPMVDVRNRT